MEQQDELLWQKINMAVSKAYGEMSDKEQNQFLEQMSDTITQFTLKAVYHDLVIELVKKAFQDYPDLDLKKIMKILESYYPSPEMSQSYLKRIFHNEDETEKTLQELRDENIIRTDDLNPIFGQLAKKLRVEWDQILLFLFGIVSEPLQKRLDDLNFVQKNHNLVFEILVTRFYNLVKIEDSVYATLNPIFN